MFGKPNVSSKTIIICGLALITSLASVPAAGFSVIHAFAGKKGNDGGFPEGSLIADGVGNLYGTTAGGGAHNDGTVFELMPPPLHSGAWTEKVLYDFKGYKKADGAGPLSSLIADSAGSLYGTTIYGGTGSFCCGTVFKLAPNGTETVLYTFCAQNNCADGKLPRAGLVVGNAGNFYGTTPEGGANCPTDSGCGVIFKLAPDGTYTVLYSFCSQTNCSDGARSYDSLIVDSAGNLYGTTLEGGNQQDAGAVFKLASDGTYTVLYTFCSQSNCTDGATPSSSLIADRVGNLYGTTAGGGMFNGGTIFKLLPNGTESVLYSFGSKSFDGSDPNGVGVDGAGNFYGTTQIGGDSDQSRACNFQTCGTVFKLARDGTETILHSFRPGADGVLPLAGVLIQNGHLFGTTYASGANRHGTVFELRE